MNKNPIIALLTDFGHADAYVGTMKGVMLSICPAARLVDITHAIAPQNVRQAAYTLLTVYRYFPAQTVFLVVVDPGVGTVREPIAVQTSHGLYVAPDNGVLSYVLAELPVVQCVALRRTEYRLSQTSQTFHGRDIFSPAAAYLARGVPVTALGPAWDELKMLPAPRLVISGARIEGEVLHIDHFGNVVTSIGRLIWLRSDMLELSPQFGEHRSQRLSLPAAACRLQIGTHTLQTIWPTYGAVAPGCPTLLIGSSGQLEMAVNQGSAAQALNAALGDPVTLTWDE